MAEQWQLRKGSTAENEGFVGAEGELTYDTTTKAVHVHDGETAGGALIDAVVAYQLPTSENGYIWYRKYASGWVEQGVGPRDLTSAVYTFTFPIPMQTSNYFVLTGLHDSLNTTTMTIKVNSRTTTSLQCRNTYQASGSTINGWVEVKGMAA